jgi:hypothetical protein
MEHTSEPADMWRIRNMVGPKARVASALTRWQG